MSTHDMVAVLFVVFIVAPALRPIVEGVLNLAFGTVEKLLPPPPTQPGPPYVPPRRETKHESHWCGYCRKHTRQEFIRWGSEPFNPKSARCCECLEYPDRYWHSVLGKEG